MIAPTSYMYPHRMNIWRDTGQRDRFGNRDVQVTQTERGLVGMTQTTVDTPCRWNGEKGGLSMEERSTLVFKTETTVYCAPNVDVHEADRIRVYDPRHNNLLLVDGVVTLIEPTYSLADVHHLEIQVTAIRSPLF